MSVGFYWMLFFVISRACWFFREKGRWFWRPPRTTARSCVGAPGGWCYQVIIERPAKCLVKYYPTGSLREINRSISLFLQAILSRLAGSYYVTLHGRGMRRWSRRPFTASWSDRLSTAGTSNMAACTTSWTQMAGAPYSWSGTWSFGGPTTRLWSPSSWRTRKPRTRGTWTDSLKYLTTATHM